MRGSGREEPFRAQGRGSYGAPVGAVFPAGVERLGKCGLLPVVGLDVGVAAGEEFVQRGAEGVQVAAAGSEKVEVLLYGPGGQDSTAGEVEAEGLDAVLVVDVEEEVAEKLPGLGLAERVGVAGASEVEQRAVDDQVGVRGDAGVREGRSGGADIGSATGAQGAERPSGVRAKPIPVR